MTAADDIVELELTEVGPRGDAMAVHLDGRPIYVAYGIAGERVRARVYKRTHAWIGAELIEVLRPSPHRATPPCPLYGTCTGCQLQHVSAAHQLEIKRDMVRTQLRRFGGFTDLDVRPTLAAPEPLHYRNHARFTVRRGTLGFIRKLGRRFFAVDRCLLMEPRINDVVARLQGRLQETTQCNIRVGAEPDAISIQPRLSLADVTSGQDHVMESLGGARFRVSNAAFFQVNRAQAERMLSLLADELAGCEHGVLVDAYAGVGTFAIVLAARVARVIAIEESGPAVRDARINAAGIANVEFRLGKTEDVLVAMADEHLAVDAVILDPPRSGCHAGTLSSLARLRPRKLLYVSCDPSTLARDLRTLCSSGYAVRSVQPIDMFPQTAHVECLAVLELNDAAPQP